MDIQNISSGMTQQDRFPWINAYLIEGSGIIDPGMGYHIEKNTNLANIDKVFLTFPYIEHFGALEDFDFGDVTIYVREGEVPEIERDYDIVEVSGGDRVVIGGKEFKVIERQGIMPSIGLYSQEERVLFAGHLFIENHAMIKSHDSKDQYLGFLRNVEGMDLNTVYPAHGKSASPDFIKEEINRVRELKPEQIRMPGSMDSLGNSMVRAFEHEWNRGFENPFRRYLPHEKWMFYSVDPDHGVMKAVAGILMMYLSIAYVMLFIWFRSEKRLESKYNR